MKIAHLINSLATGGAEKLLVETVPMYEAAGIKIDVIVANGKMHPFTKILQETSQAKIFSLGAGSVYNPLLIFKLMRHFRHYDIVHVHLFPVQYFAAIAKCLSRNKVKLVFTEHNTSNRRIKHWYFKPLEKQIYKAYSKLICITQEIESIYKKYLPKLESKWKLIGNGVNISAMQKAIPLEKPSLEKSILETDKLLIQVAAFREQKDQATLIKSMALLPLEIKLLLVGEGATKNSCMQLVKALGLMDRVFFLGLRMDVPQLLKTADIVVLSSKYEGLSLSSIEGMAAGKPFIASDVPGLTELVSGAGLLFECGNEKELAFHIKELLQDPMYYKNVADACLERAQDYTIEKMVAAHIELYKKLFNETQS
jgi:glycosyltransferase involved in cell wall biosynthesis